MMNYKQVHPMMKLIMIKVMKRNLKIRKVMMNLMSNLLKAKTVF